MRHEDPALEALAAEQCAARRCESAISLLEEAFVQQPSNAELSHEIGFCYSGACRRHGQVSLPLAIAYFERAFALVRIGGPAAVRARYLDSLGNARLANREPSAAVSPLEEAAQIYQDLGPQEEWARTEYNLGNVSCELAEVGVPSRPTEDSPAGIVSPTFGGQLVGTAPRFGSTPWPICPGSARTCTTISGMHT